MKKTLFRPKVAPRSLVTSFIYPTRGGIGEIARGYVRERELLGATVITGAPVTRVHRDGARLTSVEYGGANPSQSSTSGVFEVGVGLDVRILGPLKLRGEFRDFNSSEPPINLNTGNRYSHLYAGAGLAFAF